LPGHSSGGVDDGGLNVSVPVIWPFLPDVKSPVSLVQVSYTNVAVSAPGAGSRAIPGTFSATRDPDWPG
jgi:hypothetical protein